MNGHGEDECVRPHMVPVIYNHLLPVFNFLLGKDTHWHSTKIFMKYGARS
jgi:hypothetical protein